MNWLTVTILTLFLGLLVYAESDLPDSSNDSAPTRIHVVPRYVEQSYPETRTPNIVTSVLADYRGYDTLGETVVILTAGIAVILILPRKDRRGQSSMRGSLENMVVEGVSSFLVPFIQIFAFYAITHGHYGPGGGFQGGVVLAASMMLLRLSRGEEYEHRRFSPTLASVVAAIGMLIYALAGLLPLAWGGNFLDYAYLPIPGLSAAELRYHGILIVETGVGLVVWGTLVILFDYLMGSEP